MYQYYRTKDDLIHIKIHGHETKNSGIINSQ